MPSKKIKPLPEIVIVVKHMCGNMAQGTMQGFYGYLLKENVAQETDCCIMVTITITTHSTERVSNLKDLPRLV